MTLSHGNGECSSNFHLNFKLSHLNVNGWTLNNAFLRSDLLKYSNADVISVNEAHLKASDQINIQGYHWIGFNREVRHIRAPKSFGGVGFFLKNSFLNEFNVHIVDIEIDGLLGILLTNKISETQMLIFSGYLPPEKSK